MTNPTGLAAVAAATAGTGTTITQAQLDAAVAVARAEGHAAGLAEGEKKGLAEGEKAGRVAGATAERARLAGIEAHALPGHDKLVADMKADPAVTPDMAAGRILAAEKAMRDNQMAGIRGVEQETGKVGAAAASQRRDGAVAQAPTAGVAKSKEAYMADWQKSAALQADFATPEGYANYAAGVADGRIRVLNPGAGQTA